MTDEPTAGDRIAKVMARAGVASRRDAERLIVEGRVAVNGKTVTSPALDVLPTDRVTLDGKPIDAPQAARLWLYYKPLGLVTSEKDEKGRQTVFESLPDGMPRVMSIGRLDLNSEGLLLLTNDGGLKRRLELPSTGWLRKYRVRVNGRPNEATFDPLRRGVTIDGEDFQPMEIVLDRQQGANAWLTIGLREGKNREIRRAMTEVGLIVNRLIRVSYGPFRLNKMEPGEVVEVKQKVLKDQLGESGDSEGETRPRRTARPDRSDGDRKPRPPRAEGASFDRKPRAPRAEGGSFDRKPRTAEGATGGYDRKPRAPRAEGEGYDRKPRAPRADGGSYDRKPRAAEGATGGYDRKPRPPRAEGEGYDRKPRAPRADGGSYDRKPRAAEGATGGYDRKPRPPRAEGEGYDRKPRAAEGATGGYDRKPRSTDSGAGADRKPRAPYGAGKPSDKGPRPARGAESGERKPYAPRPKGEGPSGKPRGPRPGNPKGPGRK
jgi:23S rRNA pseudouridine2605 synthase